MGQCALDSIGTPQAGLVEQSAGHGAKAVRGHLAAGITATVAHANEAKESVALDLSGGITVVSDYRFRGVSNSDGMPAIQGFAEIAHRSGMYGGAWASTLPNESDYGHSEIDLYVGWSGALNPHISAKAELIYYLYPNARTIPGFASNSFEASVAFSATGGAVTPTVGVAYAWPQGALDGRSNTYVFAEAEAPIRHTPLSVKAHVGYTDGSYSISPSGHNLDWSLGVDLELPKGFLLGVQYVGIDRPRIESLSNDTVIFKIEKSF